ncbi:MAG: DUF21 domain-containing protein [Alphaproteobacteria bacterium]|nr:DUF21 domain-containing protein [Alphaproteobacteria bacterium]
MHWEYIIVGLLILLNGFFAMAELAVFTSRRALLQQMADDRYPGARQALKLLQDPSLFLSTIQTAMTVVSIGTGTFSGATFAEELGIWLDGFAWIAPNGGSLAMTIVVACVSYFTLFIGELVPKRIGVARAEIIAARLAPFLLVFATVTRPVVWLLKASTDWCLHLIGLGGDQTRAVTEEEVKQLITEGAQLGVFAQAEKQMLEGVMRLADRSVRSVMTPRIDMVWLGIDESPEEVRKLVSGSGYSRFPVARGDLKEVTGVVYTKDLLNLMLAGKPLDIAAVQRKALIVPDTTPVMDLLDQFKKSGQHQAIVIDEYGTVEGMVTVTDILSGIAGEMPETGQQNDDTKPVQREDGSWLIDGLMPIDEVESGTGLRGLMIAGGDYHTLAGFMLAQLGRIPTEGDHFEWQGARFEVMDMDNRRVDKVLIVPAPSLPEDGPGK